MKKVRYYRVMLSKERYEELLAKMKSRGTSLMYEAEEKFKLADKHNVEK